VCHSGDLYPLPHDITIPSPVLHFSSNKSDYTEPATNIYKKNYSPYFRHHFSSSKSDYSEHASNISKKIFSLF